MIKLAHFTEKDFQKLIQWIPNSEFFLQWAGPELTYPLTYEQLLNDLKGANVEGATTYIFKAIDCNSDETVGHISLGKIDRVNRSARLRRVLVGPTETRGKGYGTEMVEAVLSFAFESLKLHKVTLGVFDFNDSAIHCYEKAGFRQEGLLRDARKSGEAYWSLIEMGILENEWKERTDRDLR